MTEIAVALLVSGAVVAWSITSAADRITAAMIAIASVFIKRIER